MGTFRTVTLFILVSSIIIVGTTESRLIMRTGYFIRHSIRDITIHHEDAPLTNEGKILAKKLVESYENVPIAAIFSSPLKRTFETVRTLADYFNLSIIEINNLENEKWAVNG